MGDRFGLLKNYESDGHDISFFNGSAGGVETSKVEKTMGNSLSGFNPIHLIFSTQTSKSHHVLRMIYATVRLNISRNSIVFIGKDIAKRYHK